jgi:hypothetical protein
MGKRKVAGFGKSKGVGDVPLFPEGKYVMHVESHSEKESSNGLGTMHTYRMRCIDVLNDGAEQQDMLEKVYFHRMYEMFEDHPSFEQWGSIFVDELKSFYVATGVADQVKADNIDFDLSVEKSFIATIKQQEGQDEEGRPRKQNKISKYEPDEQ